MSREMVASSRACLPALSWTVTRMEPPGNWAEPLRKANRSVTMAAIFRNIGTLAIKIRSKRVIMTIITNIVVVGECPEAAGLHLSTVKLV